MAFRPLDQLGHPALRRNDESGFVEQRSFAVAVIFTVTTATDAPSIQIEVSEWMTCGFKSRGARQTLAPE
jgi:hypothetical protein